MQIELDIEQVRIVEKAMFRYLRHYEHTFQPMDMDNRQYARIFLERTEKIRAVSEIFDHAEREWWKDLGKA